MRVCGVLHKRSFADKRRSCCLGIQFLPQQERNGWTQTVSADGNSTKNLETLLTHKTCFYFDLVARVRMGQCRFKEGCISAAFQMCVEVVAQRSSFYPSKRGKDGTRVS